MRKANVSLPPILAGALMTLALVAPARPALAISGFYLQVGGGYGKLAGSDLIVTKANGGNSQPAPNGSPDPGPTAQARLGYSLFGFGGIEGGILAHGWDLGANTGGAGFAGGGIRLFPLRFLGLLGLETSDFPIDVGVGGMFGYALIGKDFAYNGTFFDFDLTVEYKLFEFLSAGLKIDFVVPQLNNFVYTDYGSNLGRCLDANGHQLSTDSNTGVPMGPLGPQPNDQVTKKSLAQCGGGKGPSAFLASPQVVFTFHFDPFE